MLFASGYREFLIKIEQAQNISTSEKREKYFKRCFEPWMASSSALSHTIWFFVKFLIMQLEQQVASDVLVSRILELGPVLIHIWSS